ncbi:TonB-dependent receptor [Desulfonema ishimotonii]|uniref:TonB-dependent receptor n=1 Tax=Desulfonema ishimotonii TaxID=45657 RepID=A0A401FXK8_9BACT|nr:TonB-dependent receptor [Desulfonema ishimotonii]GBC61742.1 TonB-dependent receptor [Desulfonema ishimotonii]
MKRIRFAVGIMCIIALSSGQIRAEEGNSGTGDTMYMEEVVVTSTRTENKIMETPSNISVIHAKDLDAMDAKTVADALKKLPGVNYSNSSGLEPKLSLRATRIGMSPGALVLLNGIPVNIGKFGYVDWESLPVENIERVEVVKGPMSALYGGNSSRGVINIITKRGQAATQGKVSAVVGDNNDQRYSALVHGGTEKWDYNVNAKKRTEDGYRDESEIDNYYFNGEVGYWLSEETRIGAYVNVTDKERILAKKLTREQRDEDPQQTLDLSDTENTDIISGLNLDVRKSLYDINTTLYYKNRDKDYANYVKAHDGTPYKEELEEDVYGTRAIFTLRQPLMGRKNRLSVGFDYDRDESDLETVKAESKDPDVPYTKPDPKKSGDFTREELGLFIQDEFSVLDNLTLTLGLRYDYFEFENNADYDFSQDGKYDYETNPDYDKWNPRVSLSYRPIRNLSVYGSYSRSYRAPSIYDYYASGSYSAKNAYTLEPETFTQYETGVRYAVARWLNIDTSVFRISVDDMLDSAYDEDGTYMGKQNINEATIKGFEMALSGTPCEWFSYKIAYTYTDARYSADFYSKADKDTVVNINGNRLTKTPYNVLNIDTDFRLWQWKDYELLWHVNLQAQDEYRMDDADDKEYPGYALVNTKLRLEHKSFEAFIALDNVLDKDYDNYAYSSYGTEYFYPADGTTWAVGVAYKF